MSSATKHRTLDVFIRSEYLTGSTDYDGYLYPGTFNDKPRPPMNPFKLSKKSIDWAIQAETFRASISGSFYL